MAASEYGLSIVLDFEDNASAGMKSAESTFSSLSGSADKLTMGVGSTADSLLDLNTSVVGMSVMGSQLQNMGQGLLGVLGSVGGQVIETGSNFESFKLTLDALYGSSEAATGVINDLFQYAVKSPYNVTDLQDMVVTLKSQGLEAFDEMTNASTGFAQSTMAWIGDLQAFRPGVAASRWKLALQNFLSGTDTQSSRVLRNILDVGDLATYVGHDLGTTVTERFQTLMDLVTKMNMAGMQNTLQQTWSVTLANMGDAWEQFAYRLGFGNKSTGLYQSAVQTAQNILSAMTDVFTNDSVIDATSNALKSLISPLESISGVIAGLAPAFSEWLGQHPQLVSFATGLTTVSGVALVAGGSLLKLSSGVMNWMLNVQRLGGLTGIFNMLGNSLTALTYRTAGIGSVGLMAYLAWRNNVLGIRDLLTGMGGEIKSVFTTVVEDISTGNKTITESLNAQGFTPFTQGLEDLREVAGSVGESLYNGFTKVFELFGVNLPELSSETFSLKNIMNSFGESLTERFGDVDEFREKYGGLISTIGTVGGAFISTLAASTLLSGGIKAITSGFSSLMTNLKVVSSTLMSPMGLLGVGVAALTAGYYDNFLGLQDVVTPVVDGIRAKIDQLVTSFSQKDSSGKNNIVSVITDKITGLYEQAKTWKSEPLVDFISWGKDGKTTHKESVTMGTLIANGLMTGLMLFGNPLQKALGLGMLTVAHNVGNVQDGIYNVVDDIINAKDLLVEMSTGYGPKAQSMAEQFNLTEFAEGLVDIKDTFKSAGLSFLEGITESNNILGNWLRDTFPDLDFSVNGLLNSFGSLGTNISEALNTDKGKTFMKEFGSFTSQLGVASAASAVFAGGMGLLLKAAGGIGGMALGMTNALVNPFTLGTVALVAYQRDFGGIHTKLSNFIARQKEVIGIAKSYRNNPDAAVRFDSESNPIPVDVEAVNAFADAWERKGELLSSLWSGITTGVGNAAGEITSVITSLFDLTEESDATLVEQIGNKIIEFGGFDSIKQKLDNTGQSFGEIATKGALVAGVFSAVSAAGRALGISLDPISSGLKMVSQGFDLVKSGASQAVMGVFDGLGDMVRSSSGSLSRTFGVVRDLFIESFAGRGGGGLDGIRGMGADLITSLKSTFTLLTGGFFSGAFGGKGIRQAMQEAFSDLDPDSIFGNWKKGLSNLFKSADIRNPFAGFKDYMVDTWGSSLSNMGRSWKGFGRNFISSVRDFRGSWGNFADNVRVTWALVGDYWDSSSSNIGKAFTNIKSTWGSLSDSMGTSFKSIGSSWVKSWGNLTDSLNKFKTVSKDVLNIGKDYPRVFRWLFAGNSVGKHTLDALSPDRLFFDSEYKGGFSKAFSGMRNSIGSFVRDLSSNVRSMFSNLFSSLGDTAKGFGSVFSNMFSSVKDTVKGVGYTFGELFSALKSSVKDVWSVTTNLFKSIASTIGNTAKSLFTMFRSVYNVAAGALAPIGTFLANNAGNIVMTVAQVATTIQTIRWQTMFGMLKSGLGMFTQAFLGASKMVIGLTGMATGFSMLTAAALTFGTLTTTEWDSLSQTLQEQDTLIAKVSAGYDWFTEKLAGATSKAVEFISSFDVEGFVGKVANTLGTLGESIVAIVGGTTGTNGLADLGGRLIDSALSGLTNNSSKIGASVQKVFNSVTSAIQTYAPSIGQNLGTLIGKAFQFAGNNAGTFVNTAFTLIQSFVNGLVANKQQIVNGALQIVDALIEGIQTHGGEIVNGAMEIVSMFVDGLSSRSGEIGEAANTIIEPLLSGIRGNLSKLEGIAKEAVGGILDTIGGALAEGLANILTAVRNAAYIIAGILGGIATALAFVPGMQLLSGELYVSAMGLAALGGVSNWGASKLENYAQSTEQATEAVQNFNAEAGEVKTVIPEADFSQFQAELNQYDLKKMWANDEIVYTVHTNDDGSTEEVSYKVERLGEGGEISYQLVMQESGKSGTEVVDENKAYAESTPAEQSVQASDDGSVKSAIDSNVTYAEENPIKQAITVDEETYGKNEAQQEIEQHESQARADYASQDPERRNMMANSSSLEYNQGKIYNPFTWGDHGAKAEEFWSSWTSASNKYVLGWVEQTSQASYNEMSQMASDIIGIYGDISKAIQNKPADWMPTDADWEAYKQLMAFDPSILFGESATASKNTMGQYITDLLAIKAQFEGSEGIEFTVKFNDDGSVASVEEVKQNAEELDGKTSEVGISADGAQETSDEINQVGNDVDALNGKTGEATVSESGAEETQSKVAGVNEELANMDGSKNVEVTTDTDTMSIQELSDALSKVKDYYEIKISVLVSGVEDVNNLKSVLDNSSGGTFGMMAAGLTIPITVQVTGMEAVNELKSVLNSGTGFGMMGAGTTINITATVTGQEAVSELRESLNDIVTTTVNLTALVVGQTSVAELKTTIENTNSKIVTVTALVSGQSAVDSLRASIDALTDKTVTVTTVTKEVKEKNAAGTYNFGGGWTYINEQGGELVNLPSGSQIIPHDLSLREQYSKGFETGEKRARADLEQFANLTSPTINMSQLNAPSSPISQDSYDYSVNFNEGSIVVKVDNAKGDMDYAAAAEKIWYYIDRKQKRDALARRNR